MGSNEEMAKKPETGEVWLETLDLKLEVPSNLYVDSSSVDSVTQRKLLFYWNACRMVDLGILLRDQSLVSHFKGREPAAGLSEFGHFDDGGRDFKICYKKNLPKAFECYVLGHLETRVLMRIDRLDALEKALDTSGRKPEGLRNLDPEVIADVGGFYACERARFSQFRLQWTAPKKRGYFYERSDFRKIFGVDQTGSNIEGSNLKKSSEAYQWLKRSKE